MRRIFLTLAVLCTPVCMMAQAPAVPSPTEALADAMAPFLATRQQPDDLTEADQRALALGRARAAEACQQIDAQMLDARTPLELARLCLFGQQYEPARQAALRALHTVPEAGQWEAHQLLAEAFLGLDNPVNAAIQLLAVEASGHFDPAAYRLIVRAPDAGGVLQDRSMNALCHVQLAHALALLEQGKVLEDASDTIAPDQMMRDAYFSLSLLQARHEATDATLEARLQKAAQLPALRALVGGRATRPDKFSTRPSGVQNRNARRININVFLLVSAHSFRGVRSNDFRYERPLASHKSIAENLVFRGLPRSM